jgi:EAL domain-containing protein (putative c-di-GMP-specific phosphodiesterase class I)
MLFTTKQQIVLERCGPSSESGKSFLSDAARTLDVALQPIVDINTGAIFGCESLLRNYDSMQFERPSEVFDHAADLSVLHELDQLLLGKALKKLSARPDLKKCVIFLTSTAARCYSLPACSRALKWSLVRMAAARRTSASNCLRRTNRCRARTSCKV